jgi:hypothetical protein
MITILDSTIKVLKVLLVLKLSIPLLLCVPLLSLNLLTACTCRWGPGAPESISPVGSWSADLSRQHLRWLDLSDSSGILFERILRFRGLSEALFCSAPTIGRNGPITSFSQKSTFSNTSLQGLVRPKGINGRWKTGISLQFGAFIRLASSVQGFNPQSPKYAYGSNYSSIDFWFQLLCLWLERLFCQLLPVERNCRCCLSHKSNL